MSEELIRKMAVAHYATFNGLTLLQAGKVVDDLDFSSMRAALMVLARNVDDNMGLASFRCMRGLNEPADKELVSVHTMALAAAIRKAVES